jgi:antitoxin (DNA-binding transcriptional repressor) of toxin-antitoxin stability system
MTLAETKSHLSAVVDQVQAGEEIVITRRGHPVARIIADRRGPERDPVALAKELRAFVLAQPMAEGNSVVAMREMDRY